MRHPTSIRVLAAAAAFAALTAVTGCSGGDQTDTTTAPATDAAATSAAAPAGAGVSLRMTIWSGNEDHLRIFNSIADDYIAANPGQVASITFETLPYDDYMQTLTTQIAGGNAPDLAWILESSGPEFVNSGVLADLRPTFEARDDYDLDDLLASAIALWTKDDALYAYPFSNSPFGVLVNTTMLSEAGQKLPSELIAAGEWTWDNLRDTAAAAAAASGQQGFYFTGFESYAAWQYLAEAWDAWGAEPWSDDGKTCQFTDQAMVDFMTWYHDAVYVRHAAPEAGVTADFFSGGAAMIISQISRVAGLDDSFEWDMVPIPAGPSGKAQPVFGQAGIGVMASGANPDIAADFLAFFTNPENAAKLAQYFPPPRLSLLTTEVLGAANPRMTAEQLQAVVIDQLPKAVVLPSHENFAEISDVVKTQLDSLWRADADVNAVMTGICDAIQPRLG
jgi:multiple sugar transport system substrate-binding protein